MATAPTYSSNPVQQQPLPGVRVSSSAPAEAFGGGQASPEKVTDQAASTIGKGQDLYLQEKQKADDLATTDAYNKTLQLKNQLFWDPKSGAMARRGKDAFNAVGEYSEQFDKATDDIADSLSNNEQKLMYQKMRGNVRTDLRDQLEKHVFQETQRYDDETTQSGIDVQRDNAVLNYQDPRKVQQSLGMQEALIRANGERKGLPEDAIKAQLSDAWSKTHAGIIDRMLSNGESQKADDYYQANKSSITDANVKIKLEGDIENAQATTRGQEAWQKVQGFRLPDGNPDERKMEVAVNSMDLPPKQKEKAWEFVRARAREEIGDIIREDSARDNNFYNEAVKAKNAGASLAEAMDLARKYAKPGSDYDRATKADAIRKMYAPPSQSDPSSYINLWMKVQDGTATREEIDSAMKQEKINEPDWRHLFQDWYKNKTAGDDPATKSAWQRVRILAEEKFAQDKVNKDKFLYELEAETRGKSPEEIWKTANDRLKEDPRTGYWFGFGAQKQYETSMKRRDAENLAWGKLHQDVGRNVVNGIGENALLSGSKSYGVNDVAAFANEFGGYDSIRRGTPVNNAIQSLMRHGQHVTVGNVKTMLQKFPDGRF